MYSFKPKNLSYLILRYTNSFITIWYVINCEHINELLKHFGAKFWSAKKLIGTRCTLLLL
jgi:hypothetical protein